MSEQNTENGNREAAKYRRQLREAEQQRDALQATVEGFNRNTIEQLAARHLAQPRDLFDLGNVAVADLLDAEGQADVEAIQQAAQGILADRPGLAAMSATERLLSAAAEHLEPRTLDDFDKALEKFEGVIDPTAFTDSEGNLDTERVTAFIDIAQPRRWPDIGGGARHSGLGRVPRGNAWQRLVDGA